MMMPYLELPVCIGYGQGQEERVVKGKFQPSQITAYHEGYYPEVGMFIYITGIPIQLSLSMEEYEAKIAAYWNMFATKQNVKQKLGIV